MKKKKRTKKLRQDLFPKVSQEEFNRVAQELQRERFRIQQLEANQKPTSFQDVRKDAIEKVSVADAAVVATIADGKTIIHQFGASPEDSRVPMLLWAILRKALH